MVIYNKLIPFKGFCAINLCTFIFVREEYREIFKRFKELYKKMLNHESIHSAQQKELLFIFFFIIYLIEYGINLIKYKDTDLAYRNISFEREAYEHEGDYDYLKSRKLFSMWRK